MRKMFVAAAAAVLCASAGSAFAGFSGVHEFNFALEPSQEVPPNNSNAAGAAQLLYDTASQTFDLDLMVFGIGLSDLMGAGPNDSPVHIHMAPPGVNGGIVIDLGFFADFVEDGLGIRLQLDDIPLGGVQGGVMSDIEANEAALFAGNLYLNVHTMDFPGGQIRGQIIPTPGALATLAAAGCMVTSRRRRRS